MTIQITLLLISFLLFLLLGLLVWVIRLAIQRKIFTTESTVKNGNPILTPKKFVRAKYANSRLGEMEKEQFVKEIILHLEMKKTYREPDLSITKLAKQIKIPKHYLSQIINEKMECSFLDFINRYRVEEAKEKLQAPEFQKLPILEVGKLVGFNAKSTFYAAFKKYTNSTPGDYRKLLISQKDI